MNLSNIKKISPLYSYWMSNQTDEDEKERLLIANIDSKAVYLFEKEPYKWENLFQAISRQIINGDLDSIRGMKVLLSTITATHRTKVLELFFKEGIFEEEIIEELSKIDILVEDWGGKYQSVQKSALGDSFCLLYTSPSPRDQRGSGMEG